MRSLLSPVALSGKPRAEALEWRPGRAHQVPSSTGRRGRSPAREPRRVPRGRKEPSPSHTPRLQTAAQNPEPRTRLQTPPSGHTTRVPLHGGFTADTGFPLAILRHWRGKGTPRGVWCQRAPANCILASPFFPGPLQASGINYFSSLLIQTRPAGLV